MSSSRHPIALSVERRVSSSTRLLAVVMCLPLVDGVFVAIVLGGGLASVAGILEVGLLVFAGSATIAVILAEMDESPRQQARIVLAVGALVIAGAAVQAALAPTVESVLNMDVFERFAALVVLAVAASTASARLDEYLPGPAIILVLGLIASVSPSGASLAVQADPELILRGVAAATVGVLAALAVAVTSPWLRNAVEIDRFRFGSAVALGVLALSIGGLIPTTAPVALAVLLVTAILAFDPGEARERDSVYRPDDINLTAAFSDGGVASEHRDEPSQPTHSAQHSPTPGVPNRQSENASDTKSTARPPDDDVPVADVQENIQEKQESTFDREPDRPPWF